MLHDVMQGILIIMEEHAWLSSEEISKEFDESFFCAPEFEEALRMAAAEDYIAEAKRGSGKKAEAIYRLSAEGKRYIRTIIRSQFRLTVETPGAEG